MDTPTTTSSWLQVVDDAIKIGLGALIAGVSGWIVARHNSRGEINKLKFDKKSQILSDAAKIHEDHFQAFYKYSLELVFVHAERNRTMSSEQGQAVHSAILAAHLQEATRLRFQMAQIIPNTIYVQSQLLLLGEESAVEKSRNLVKVIGEADQAFKFKGTDDFDVSNFENDSQKIGRAREEFFKELQTIYKKM